MSEFKNPLFERDIISIADFSRQELEFVIQTTHKMKTLAVRKFLKDKLVASCFFEASTRTRLSFETAVQRLGGQVIGFADPQFTSYGQKGESLGDSVRIISSFADACVMRHPCDGAARWAAEISSIPVINAGDGSNQHPSQTILDLYSIYESQGKIDGLGYAFIGDLKYGRTVHSLVQALSLFEGCKLYFVGPKELSLPEFLLQELRLKNIRFEVADSIEEVAPQVDIFYMTRLQKERFDDHEFHSVKSKFVMNLGTLRYARENAKILHPLPRIAEINTEVDKSPHAYYFEQARNGVFARQALLSLVLNEKLDF